MGETIDEPEIRLVTAALPYVNNVPHIGNIVGSHLPADIFARYCRIRGYKTLFIGGTDEHGTPTTVAAFKLKTTPEKLTDFFYKIHKDIYDWFGFSYDNFSRTSKSKIHYKVTREIFLKIFANGYIIEKEEELPYDPKAKKFLADRYIEGTCPYCGYEKARGDQCEKCGRLLDPKDLINPRSVLTGSGIEFRRTRHLYINLSKLEGELRGWIEEHRRIWKKQAIEMALGWIKEGLKPRSITRDLDWGVPVPYKELWEIAVKKIRDRINVNDKEEFLSRITNLLKNLGLAVPEYEVKRLREVTDRYWPDINRILKEYNYFEVYKNKVFYVWFDAPIGYLSFTIEKASSLIQLKDLNGVDTKGFEVLEIDRKTGEEIAKKLIEEWSDLLDEDLIYKIEGDTVFEIKKDGKTIGIISFWDKGDYLKYEAYQIYDRELLGNIGKKRILDKVLKLVLEKTKKDYIKLPDERWVKNYYNKSDVTWEKFWTNKRAKIYHFIGKDNIPFHTIFWPGMLIASNKTKISVKVRKFRRNGSELFVIVDNGYTLVLERKRSKIVYENKEYQELINEILERFNDESKNKLELVIEHKEYEPDIVKEQLNLPYNVVGLQYLNYEGDKISKSRSWGVFCERLPNSGLDPDYWRFYLSLLIPENKDTEFTWKGFKEAINKELIGNFGNFVNRVLTFVWKNYNGDLSEIEPEENVIRLIEKYVKEIEGLYENVKLVDALKKILEFSSQGNKLFQERKPWEDSENSKRFLKGMLYYVRALAILISPFLPNTSRRILEMLNYPECKWDNILRGDLIGKIGEPKILFKKITEKKIEELKKKTTIITNFEEVFQTL